MHAVTEAVSENGLGAPLGVLAEKAAAPYRAVGAFAWHFARGKLKGDPVFAGLLRHDLIPPGKRILDLGCGQGLLSAWLHAARACYDSDAWVADCVAPPLFAALRGIDLRARDIERAQAAGHAKSTFEQGDICDVDLGSADIAVILDVLHFIEYPRQEVLLRRVREALGEDGLLLLRVADGACRWRFWLSQSIDWLVAALRGHFLPRLYGRPLAGWREILDTAGFAVEALPMSGDTPFANVLLVGRTRGSGAPNITAAKVWADR